MLSFITMKVLFLSFFTKFNFITFLAIIFPIISIVYHFKYYYYEIVESWIFWKVTTYFKNITKISLLSIIILTNITYFNNFLVLFNFVNGMVLLIVFLIIHSAFYFLTIYQTSKFTTQIKYYWIRVYHVIWLMEIYLFGLLIFLYIIHPEELKHGLRQSDFFRLGKPEYSFFKTFHLIYLLLIANLIFTIALVTNNSLLIKLAKLVNVNILIYLFSKEVMILINSQLFSQIIDLKKKTIGVPFWNTNHRHLTDIFQKLHTTGIRRHNAGKFILNVILIAKYLHVYLIVLFNLIIIANTLNNNSRTSLLNVAFLQQNIIIILLFYYSNYIMFFKFLYKTIVYGNYKSASFFYIINKWYYIFFEIF